MIPFRSVVLCLFVGQIFGNTNIPLHVNMKLDLNLAIRGILDGTLPRCADACVFQTDCASVSFHRRQKECEMYNTTYDAASANETDVANNTILIDVALWPKTRTGACWNKPCPAKMTCVPVENSYICNKDNETMCSPYILPEHGVLLDENHDAINDVMEVYPIGSTLFINCQPPYVTSNADPSRAWKVRCKATGMWSWSHSCYTVEELCIHPVLQRFYPTRAAITVSSSVSAWNDTYAFLNSTKGWKADVSDEEQYIQVQFDVKYWIGGLITKGVDGEWVTYYNVSYSEDCATFEFVMEPDYEIPKEFIGNVDATNSVTNHFETPLEMKCLKIHPTSYEGAIAMRLDVLACKEYDEDEEGD